VLEAARQASLIIFSTEIVQEASSATPLHSYNNVLVLSVIYTHFLSCVSLPSSVLLSVAFHLSTARLPFFGVKLFENENAQINIEIAVI